MGKIQTVPLNEICETIQYGYTASAAKEPVGPKFVRITDIVPDAIDWAEVPYCQIEESKKEKYVLKSGDIVIARTGATTGYAKYLKNPPPSIFASYLVRVRVKEGVDPRYIGFVVQSDTYKRFIKTHMGGAAQPNANAKVLTSFPILLPSFQSQKKIATILSAYDDLIENNLRRIKILEEMAQTLYREWFVKFRFPGHQKVRMVDSPLGKIPEGWEVANLDDVLATLESGSRPKGGIDPEARGVPSIGAENIIGLGRYDYSKEKFVTREFFDNMNRGHIQSGDVLLYKDGAQIGRKSMFRDGFPHAECCINEHVFIMRTNGRCSQNYLFFWLDQPEMTQNIINLNANAAQPGINQSGVRGLPILLPPAPLLKDGEQVLEPMLGALFNNAKRNNILRQTRDLLLPKLISGELDVSELDIAIPEANA